MKTEAEIAAETRNLMRLFAQPDYSDATKQAAISLAVNALNWVATGAVGPPSETIQGRISFGGESR